LEKTQHLAVKFRHRGVERLAPGIDYDGPLWAQLVQMKAHCVTQAPLDAVAHNGFAERARHRETDPWSVRLRLADAESREQRTGMPGAFVINSAEVLRSQQTNTFRKTRDGELPLVTDSELLAAGGPAAGENGPAVLGFHPRAEAMRFGAVSVIRLKSTFRHCSSII
jgi:hypothetical protein